MKFNKLSMYRETIIFLTQFSSLLHVHEGKKCAVASMKLISSAVMGANLDSIAISPIPTFELLNRNLMFIAFNNIAIESKRLTPFTALLTDSINITIFFPMHSSPKKGIERGLLDISRRRLAVTRKLLHPESPNLPIKATATERRPTFATGLNIQSAYHNGRKYMIITANGDNYHDERNYFGTILAASREPRLIIAT